MRGWLVLCSTIGVSAATLPHAQQRRGEPPKPAVETRPSAYSTAVIDPSSERLGIRYGGNDLRAVFESLSKRGSAKKGEFETTAAFEARTKEDAARPLSGSLTNDSLYAFRVIARGSEFSGFFARYDADKGEMLVRVTFDPMHDKVIGLGTTQGALGADSLRVELPKDSYEATNAFGARVRVDAEYWSHDAVSVRNIAEFVKDPQSMIAHVEQRLPMPVEQAQQIKPNLQALLIGHLSPPYVTSGMSTVEPTFNNPHAELSVFRYVHLSVDQIVFYNMATGDVLARVRPQK